MQHLDEGTIHAWLDGALDDAEAARVEQHVDGCDSCAAAVAEARGLIAASSRILTALDDVPSDVLPAHMPESTDQLSALRMRHAAERDFLRRRRGIRRTWLSAAAIAFVAFGTTIVWRSGVRGPSSMEERAAPSPSAPSPAASAAVPAPRASTPMREPVGSMAAPSVPSGRASRRADSSGQPAARAETVAVPTRSSADQPVAAPMLDKATAELPAKASRTETTSGMMRGAAPRAVGAIGDSVSRSVSTDASLRQALASEPSAEKKVEAARDVEVVAGCYRIVYAAGQAPRGAFAPALRLTHDPDGTEGVWYRAEAIGDSSVAGRSVRWRPDSNSFVLSQGRQEGAAASATSTLRVSLAPVESPRPGVAAKVVTALPVAAAVRIACPP